MGDEETQELRLTKQGVAPCPRCYNARKDRNRGYVVKDGKPAWCTCTIGRKKQAIWDCMTPKQQAAWVERVLGGDGKEPKESSDEEEYSGLDKCRIYRFWRYSVKCPSWLAALLILPTVAFGLGLMILSLYLLIRWIF